MRFIQGVPRKVKAFSWVIALFLLLSGHHAHAQTDPDYLNTVESEASNGKESVEADTEQNETLQSTLPKNDIKLLGSERGQNQGGAITDLFPGLSIEQFLVVLKNNYIGSYLFYNRLTDRRKQEVYQFYQENPDAQKVREKILQLNKK